MADRKRIPLPADSGAAEAIRDALLAEGVDAVLIVDDLQDGKVNVRLEVPVDQWQRSRAILAGLDGGSRLA